MYVTLRLSSKFFISTPIFYVNAAPHLGHLYSVLLADAQMRFVRLKGVSNLLFSVGTDEHGLKIQQTAEKFGPDGTNLVEFCHIFSKKFQKLFEDHNIDYSNFIRTTDFRHCRAVTNFWEKLVEAGHIKKDEYCGWYSVPDETFLKESQVEDKLDSSGRKIKVSSDSGHLVEWTQEENYVFLMSRFTDEVKFWLDRTPNVIQPSIYRGNIVSMLKELPNLSVSRPSNRVSWGVPVPGDSTQTIYVWLDALINYLTVVGYPDKIRYWPPDIQVVGKDILKFHVLYWPALLMAVGLDPPHKIICHGHWLIDDVKMSKSRGNVVDPLVLSKKYSADGLRYFLLREGVIHSDCNYNEEKMRRYLNAELANTFGNLLARCTSISLHTDIPYQCCPEYSAIGQELYNQLESTASIVENHFVNFNYYLGIESIMSLLRLTNTYFQHEQPWLLRKNNDLQRLRSVLDLSLASLRVSGILLQPIVPTLSDVLLSQLGIPQCERTWQHASSLELNRAFRHSNPNKIILFEKLKA